MDDSTALVGVFPKGWAYVELTASPLRLPLLLQWAKLWHRLDKPVPVSIAVYEDRPGQLTLRARRGAMVAQQMIDVAQIKAGFDVAAETVIHALDCRGAEPPLVPPTC